MTKPDLEKTKPIKVLTDDIVKKYDEEPKMTRSEKYKIEDELSKLEREKMEEAEEALAEKNINEAEALLAAEENKQEKQPEEQTNEVKEDLNEDTESKEKEGVEEKKQENLFKRIKNKWKSMSKKKRILISVLIIIIILGITVGIIFLTSKDKKVEEAAKPTKIEDDTPTVIVDNFFYKNGVLHILDDNEKEIGTYECTNKDEKKCYVAINNYKDTFDIPVLKDETGKEKIERIKVYDNDYVFIYDNESENNSEIVLYSLKKNKEKNKYQEVKAYDEDYCIIKENGKYGLIKMENGYSEIISSKFDYLGMIDGEKNLIAKNNGNLVVVDKSGKIISKNLTNSGEIKYYNNHLVVIFNKPGYYSVYDYEGKEIASKYSFATVKDKYMFLVDKANLLYVKDKDENKYNEDGIKLNNKDYIPTYVYDESGKLKTSKLSFKTDVKEGEIAIEIYDADGKESTFKYINAYEAKINNTIAYYSYMNDRLYFYSDDKKEYLIGSVKCDTKNVITKDTKELSSCHPAKDTITDDNDQITIEEKSRKSMAPIFNSKFVFVNDGGKIKLYDLTVKDDKAKGTYKLINTYSTDTENKLGIATGSSYIIAQSANSEKGNKYGVLNIEYDKVSTAFGGFNYKKVEKIGDQFIAQTSDGKWKFLSGNNSNIYPYKIRGYLGSIVKVKSSNGYIVYNEEGKRVGTDTYEYVELYEDYYAGVKNKKIMIYDYEGKELIEEKIDVIKTTYIQVSYPAFNVIKNGNQFKITVLNNNNQYEAHYIDEKSTKEIQEPEKVELENIKLSKEELSIKIGEEVTLEYVAIPSVAEFEILSWESSDSEIVKVDEKGTIEGAAVGTATITLTTTNGKIAECKITVSETE